MPPIDEGSSALPLLLYPSGGKLSVKRGNFKPRIQGILAAFFANSIPRIQGILKRY
jgi:hypothetical protein